MIPIFPEFKRLELSDKIEVERLLGPFMPHSDYNFVSLWVYDTESDLLLSNLYGNVVIRIRDYITNKPFYSFLGMNHTLRTISRLLQYANDKDGLSYLKLIPESAVRSSRTINKRFKVIEDRDSFDYLLSVQELAHLQGGSFSKQRKLIHRFQRQYPHVSPKVLSLNEKKIQQEIIDLFYNWGREKKKENADIEHELKAILRLFINPEILDVLAVGLYNGEELISFLIIDRHHADYAQSHFFKTHPRYEGASQYLRQHVAVLLAKTGHQQLNIEQDLGIPGLRVAKELWQPVGYVKKYSVYPLNYDTR